MGRAGRTRRLELCSGNLQARVRGEQGDSRWREPQRSCLSIGLKQVGLGLYKQKVLLHCACWCLKLQMQ